MIKRIFFSVLVIFSIFVFSTPNTVHASWAKAFGYTNSTGGMVWPGADCNYYLWLTSGTDTSKRLYFSELNSSGVPQWTKTIYGTGENNLLIIQLTDGGYFVYGTKTSTATGDDILWEKFDSSWNKVYGNTFGGANDESGGPNFTDDDGFLISGTTESYLPDGSDKDMLLVKVDSSGDIEWSKAIHHGLDDGSPSIKEVSDGYLFTAEVENTTVPGTPGQAIVVVKLNKSGTIQWQKIYQGSIETSTWINSVSAPQEVTGGYLLWGSTKLNSGDLGDILLIKIDSSGTISWQKKYSDVSSSQAGIVYRVMENADGTFLLDGLIMNIGSTTGDTYNMLLMKLSSAGEIIWKKTIGGPGQDVASITETTDGNYLLSGVTSTYTPPTFDSGNILYAKLGIDLTNGSITYPWGSAKTFGSTGFESGGVFEYFDQYALFGYTQSWGVGTLDALGVFYLDSNGDFPGCPYINDVTLTEGTANLTASNTSLTTSTPTLTERQVGTAGSLSLTVATATNPTATDICSATTGSYTIAGTITSNGSGLSGVTVTLSGSGSGTTTTDADGAYSFTGLSSGTYIVTPSRSGYAFTPSSKQVTASCAVQLGVDFTATTSGPTYSISGKVTLSGSGLSGVTMTLSGSGSGTTTTDSSGDYTFSGLSNGTYTITPTKSGYTFTPVSKSVTISGSNKTGQNFTASQGGSTCETWADVIAKYNQYIGGQASWTDVINCYTDYVTP